VLPKKFNPKGLLQPVKRIGIVVTDKSYNPKKVKESFWE
jgi:hypothetical protein